jgi:hypothetical protein
MIKLGSIFCILYCIFFALTIVFYCIFFIREIDWAKRAGKLALEFAAVLFFSAIICLIVYSLNIVPRGGF